MARQTLATSRGIRAILESQRAAGSQDDIAQFERDVARLASIYGADETPEDRVERIMGMLSIRPLDVRRALKKLGLA